MKLLATFTDPYSDDTSNYTERVAGRAVIFDGEKVALLHVVQGGYYTLPGGGIDDDDIVTGMAREVIEETGCEVAIGQEVGMAITYFDRWHNKQIDYCYIARKTSGGQPTNHTAFEAAEGYKLTWAPSIDAAIELAENTSPIQADAKLVRARDLLFLRTTRDILPR